MILLFSGDPQVGVVSLPYAHTPLDQADLTGKKTMKLPFHDLKVCVHIMMLSFKFCFDHQMTFFPDKFL